MLTENTPTSTINNFIKDFLEKHNCIAACYNYEGFPGHCCISINEEACHGIPSNQRILKANDIVKIDISGSINGFFADACKTYVIKPAIDLRRNLLNSLTKRALYEGIKVAKPGNYLNYIGQSISKFCHKHKVHIVEDYGGHFIGLELHEKPFVSSTNIGSDFIKLVPGMVFTIEPITTFKKPFTTIRNGVILMEDGSYCAQWEHTIVITAQGNKILT